MIGLTDLTQDIQNGLNENANGLTFNLFSDTGKFKRAYKKTNAVTDIINGVVSIVSSETTPNVDGMLISSVTSRVEVVIRLKDEEDDIWQAIERDGKIKEEIVENGNATYIKLVRNVLSEFTQDQSVETMKAGGKTYTVSKAYNFAETGVRSQRDRTGDSMTFVFYAYFNIIENGQNSRSFVFKLDGQIIPYQQCTVSRTDISDADVYSGDTSAKATSSGSVFSVSLSVPSFISFFNTAVSRYILEGEQNVAHILEVSFGKGEKDTVVGGSVEYDLAKIFLVKFSEASNTMQGVLNVGGQITLSEIVDDFDLVSWGSLLTVKTANKSGTLEVWGYAKDIVAIIYDQDTPGYKAALLSEIGTGVPSGGTITNTYYYTTVKATKDVTVAVGRLLQGFRD